MLKTERPYWITTVDIVVYLLKMMIEV